MRSWPVAATTGALRHARGCAFAAAAAWLAAFAHVGAGGSAPSMVAVLLVGALCAAVGVHLSARRAGFARIALTLAPVQAGAHLLFEIFGQPSVTGLPADHAHHAMVTAAAGSPSPGASWSMVTLHGLAVLATAVLLAFGDRAVWRLVGWLTAVLVVFRTAARAAGGFAPPPSRSLHDVAPAVRVGRSSVSRRGPPVFGPAH